MRRGRFITFEGGEGTGKSTQARLLAQRLRAAGHDVALTREPGGSPGAEALRELLLSGEAERWSATAETLLMYAARADHLERLIQPSLEAGAWVVCDRFLDSTRAYQGAAGGAPRALIASLEAQVVGKDAPDLTLVLDLPVEIGLERAFGREMFDRFEAKGQAFHERLRQAFLDIAAAEPRRCRVIDAAGSPQVVADRVWAAARASLMAAA